jgi:hypothetical protein
LKTNSNIWQNLTPRKEKKCLAGVVGFEPTVHATKKRCLTTWPHPNSEVVPKSTLLQVQALFTANFE